MVALFLVGIEYGGPASADPGYTAEEAHTGCYHTQLRACMISLGTAFWFDMRTVAPQIAKRNELDVNGRTAHRKITIDAQSPDPAFASADVNQPVIGYSGTCYVTGTPLNLGSSSALPDISFEITGFESGTAGPSFPNDARPDRIVGDMLTNARYGAGFPSANLDVSGSLADWGNYCQAAQLAMSLLLDKQQPAARWIEEIVELTVSAVVWSGTQLKIIPYGDQPLSANGASWTPGLTAAYNYDLTYLRRGAYGAAITAHPAGTPFARFGPNDPSLFRYRYPASFVGQSVFIKLPGFNIFGQALQDIASVSAYGYTLAGTGGASVNVLANLAVRIDQDWGVLGTSIAAQADLAWITAPTGSDINLGTVG